MSRSVETISGANVIYFDASGMDDELDWSDLILNLRYELSEKYKSLYRVEKFLPYPYRENQIILENCHVQISISEYCGCGAISVFLNPITNEYRQNTEVIAEHWLAQCFAGIEKIIEQFVSPLRRLGTFSNGEAVYERKK